MSGRNCNLNSAFHGKRVIERSLPISAAIRQRSPTSDSIKSVPRILANTASSSLCASRQLACTLMLEYAALLALSKRWQTSPWLEIELKMTAANNCTGTVFKMGARVWLQECRRATGGRQPEHELWNCIDLSSA